MKRFNINQRKLIADFLASLSIAFVTMAVISQIIIQKDYSLNSLIRGLISVIMSLMLISFSLDVLKK